jgi:L-lactate dehydrogenase complex protein LldG
MSKELMLSAIRRGLRRGPLPTDQQAMLRARLATPPRGLIPARSRLPRPALIALFIANLEKEFATVARLGSVEDVPKAVADYLAEQNLPPTAVIAPHPELRLIPWASTPLLNLREGVAIGSDEIGIQHGYAGIAETGTLMLPSGPDRPTTLNLLPETAIVVLRTSRLVGALEEGWSLLRDSHGAGQMPRALMLVTGPSRSSDVEQTLELGAHGPRRLHVLLLDDEPAEQ